MGKKKQKAPAPSSLTMSLYAPGMSVLHRAGLGGLAATLLRLEQRVQQQQIAEEQVPAWPWDDNQPPWQITPTEIVLNFGDPCDAGKFLESLFCFAFQVKDDLLFLPGQYGDLVPNLEVRAQLQQGITLSFLQHGGVRKLAKKETLYSYQPDGDTGPTVQLQYKKCTAYKHQKGWEDLVAKNGSLRTTTIEVVGPLHPGAVVRHNAFAGQTKIEETAQQILPLYFAIVGCLTLPINRGSGILIVPDVVDLLEFAETREWMTPSSARECRITSAGDAALQAQIRLRAKRTVQHYDLPGCHAATFRPTPWAPQQKLRVDTVRVPPTEEASLDIFEVALAELAPRIVTRSIEKKKTKGKQPSAEKESESFWVDSIVRPLVADNLARGQPWYQGFVSLMIKIDPVTKKPVRDKLLFEKKGLHAMIEKIPWEDQGESTVVRAVHEAMRRRYGQIANENTENPVAMKKRMGAEYDRWRLAFAGAKTPDQFRKSLCDLFSRAGVNSVLQQDWESLLRMLDARSWQLTRDLALLGLASYTGKGAKEVEEAVVEPSESIA